MSKVAGKAGVWMALKRLDRDDDNVVTLREVVIPRGEEAAVVKQIVSSAFGLNSDSITLKIRNQRGCIVPFNSSIAANSKQLPYVLEVANIFQHVRPKPRTIAMSVINKSMKTRLQTIDRRIQRLEDLLPQIKFRHTEKLNQEIESLNQKLKFLFQRMQVADSHSWRGVLARAPLW